MEQFNDLILVHEPIDNSEFFDKKYYPTNLPVGEKFGCTNCHDGFIRNSLSQSIMEGSPPIPNIASHVVYKSRVMPPDGMDNSDITSNMDIWKFENLFNDEHKILLKKWITKFKCVKEAIK